jgi:periplasmic protein TonB
VKRLLLAAALALAAHALLLLFDLPPGRTIIQRAAPQAVSIRLVNPPAIPIAQPPPPIKPLPPEPIRPPAPPKPHKAAPPTPAPHPAPAVPEPVAPEEVAPQSSVSPPDALAAEPPATVDPEPAAPPAPAVADAPVRLSVPRYDINPPIVYPAPARRRNLQGTVLLDVFVTAEGRPTEVKLARSSGHAILDHSALQAVRKWHFEPARQGESPIAMWVQVPVKYALEGR